MSPRRPTRTLNVRVGSVIYWNEYQLSLTETIGRNDRLKIFFIYGFCKHIKEVCETYLVTYLQV